MADRGPWRGSRSRHGGRQSAACHVRRTGCATGRGAPLYFRADQRASAAGARASAVSQQIVPGAQRLVLNRAREQASRWGPLPHGRGSVRKLNRAPAAHSETTGWPAAHSNTTGGRAPWEQPVENSRRGGRAPENIDSKITGRVAREQAAATPSRSWFSKEAERADRFGAVRTAEPRA